MLGFMPGFPYLAGLPTELQVPRKDRPRLNAPAGSVAIAGDQAGIYPVVSPGGWQIIGRTPVRLFNPHFANPSLLQPGDRVRFRQVSADEYLEIERAAE
jgi:inhibitor of KinA